MNFKESKEYLEFGYNIVTCPICGKETLDNHFICPECNWEYDAVTEGWSDCNKHTVQEYKILYNEDVDMNNSF